MTQQIQSALVGAMRDICKLGIAKTSKASAGGANYNYRGIDAAMSEMSPILVNNGITVTPRYSELVMTEMARGAPADGKYRRCATVKGSFTFAAADGSSVTAEAYGESVDTGDKAVIKAQTVAFRTVLFQQFIVPIMSMDSELHDPDEGGGAPDDPDGLDDARNAAMEGVKALELWWGAQTKGTRVTLGPWLQELKTHAQAIDGGQQ